MIEERRDGLDFIGLFGHAELPQDQSGNARIGAQGAQCFEPARIVGAPRTLAVEGNQIVLVRPNRRNPVLEATSEQDRVRCGAPRSEPIAIRPQKVS